MYTYICICICANSVYAGPLRGSMRRSLCTYIIIIIIKLSESRNMIHSLTNATNRNASPPDQRKPLVDTSCSTIPAFRDDTGPRQR